MNQISDAIDGAILAERSFCYGAKAGPRVGDWVEMLDGSVRRFTHDWGDEIQTTSGSEWGRGDQSFYLGKGYCSFSGSLDRAIPKGQLVDAGEQRQGSVWFFHHNETRAHNGVRASMPFRVFRQVAP